MPISTGQPHEVDEVTVALEERSVEFAGAVIVHASVR
jgi:hypothetical protein